LDLAARRGDYAVVVKAYDGFNAVVDAVVGGRSLLGLAPPEEHSHFSHLCYMVGSRSFLQHTKYNPSKYS